MARRTALSTRERAGGEVEELQKTQQKKKEQNSENSLQRQPKRSRVERIRARLLYIWSIVWSIFSLFFLSLWKLKRWVTRTLSLLFVAERCAVSLWLIVLVIAKRKFELDAKKTIFLLCFFFSRQLSESAIAQPSENQWESCRN